MSVVQWVNDETEVSNLLVTNADNQFSDSFYLWQLVKKFFCSLTRNWLENVLSPDIYIYIIDVHNPK